MRTPRRPTREAGRRPGLICASCRTRSDRSFITPPGARAAPPVLAGDAAKVLLSRSASDAGVTLLVRRSATPMTAPYAIGHFAFIGGWRRRAPAARQPAPTGVAAR